MDRVTRAYLYENGPHVDSQITIINTVYGWNWKKVDAQQEYDLWINQQGE